MHCALSSFLVSQVLQLSPSSSFLFTTIFWSRRKIMICCSKIGQKSGCINYDTFRISEWVSGIFWWERLAKATPCDIMNWTLIWQLQAIQFDTCNKCSNNENENIVFRTAKVLTVDQWKAKHARKEGVPPLSQSSSDIILWYSDIRLVLFNKFKLEVAHFESQEWALCA